MERIETDGPEEFVRALMATLQRGYASDVVFRGERDLFPTVLPTALRASDDGADELMLGYFADTYIHTHGGAVQTPAGTMLRATDAWDGLDGGKSVNMPSTYVHALAQHHGLPTRLLDVTRNPLIAAYFAVDYRSEDDVGRFVRVIVVGRKDRGVTDCRVVSVPPSANARLHRQAGAFLTSKDWGQDRRTSLLDLESEVCVEVTLSSFWVDQLRLLLQRLGVSPATVYGDLDSVAAEARWRAEREHAMLADPPDED